MNLKAWDPIDKKMGVVETYFPMTGKVMFENDNCDWYKRDRVVLRPTGLKDRNGKEIYEGDLIQTKMIRWAYSGEYEGMGNIVGEVKFDDGRFLLHLTNGASPDLIFGSAHHTVIGNIFENRELLEVVPTD